MRLFRRAVVGLLVLILALLAFGNRHMVAVHLSPAPLAHPALQPVEMPLFLLIALCVLAGFLLGIILEWIREGAGRRRAAGRLRRERKELQKTLRRTSEESPDDRLPAPPSG